MFPLAKYCLLLAASSVLALELLAIGEEEIGDAERMPYELFRNYGSHKESLVYEGQIDSQDKPFTWHDCGGMRAAFNLKSLSISPLPLHAPGNITIAFNATINADIEAPISVGLDVRRKVDHRWETVCKGVPGGACDWKNICDIQPTAAAEADEEDGYMDASQSPICPLKKGNFSLPPTTFALPAKATSGLYAIRATFRKEKKRIACVIVNDLNVE